MKLVRRALPETGLFLISDYLYAKEATTSRPGETILEPKSR
jgi:hypothetical protein